MTRPFLKLVVFITVITSLLIGSLPMLNPILVQRVSDAPNHPDNAFAQILQLGRGHVESLEWADNDHVRVTTPFGSWLYDENLQPAENVSLSPPASTPFILPERPRFLEAVRAYAFNPERTQVTAAYDENVIIYAADTEEAIFSIPFNVRTEASLYWSPDGTHLALVAEDHATQVWNIPERRLAFSMPSKIIGVPFDSDVYQAMYYFWSPQGNHIGRGVYYRSVEFWSLETRQVTASFEGEDLTIMYHPYESLVVISPFGIFETDNYTSVYDFDWRRQRISVGWTPAWSPDARFLAFANDKNFQGTGRIYVLDVATLEVVRYFMLSNSNISRLSWSPNGDKLLSLGRNNEIRTWDVMRASPIGVTRDFGLIGDYPRYLNPFAFSDDSSLLAVGDKYRAVNVWETGTGSFLSRLGGHQFNILMLEWQPGTSHLATHSRSHIVTSLAENMLRVWEGRTGELIERIESQLGIWSFEWSPNGDRLAIGTNTGILTFDMITRRMYGNELNYSLPTVTWTQDGRHIFVEWISGSRQRELVDPATGETPYMWATHSSNEAYTWSPDSRYFLSAHNYCLIEPSRAQPNIQASDCFIGVKHVFDRELLPELVGSRIYREGWEIDPVFEFGEHLPSIEFLQFSPNATYLATHAHNRTLYIWEMDYENQDGELLMQIPYVESFLWSPDEARLAINVKRFAASYLQIWDVETRRLTFGFPDAVSPQWSPDGSMLLTQGRNSDNAAVWDSQTGEYLGFLGAGSYTWSPDSRFIAALQRDLLTVWRFNPD